MQPLGRHGRTNPRAVLVLQTGPNASVDYYLRPRLEADASRPWAVVNLSTAPADVPLLRFEDVWVVICRYINGAWIDALKQMRPSLAGVSFFVDDDLPAMMTEAGSAFEARLKVATRYGRFVSDLEALVSDIWVSTPALAKRFDVPVRVLPPVPFDDPLPPLRNQPPLIVYHGTVTHDAERAFLHQVAVQLDRAATPLRLEVSGGALAKLAWAFRKKAVVRPQAAWPVYLREQRSRSAAIMLAPLTDGLVNSARAPVKVFDAARLGAVGLYADKRPYSDVVTEGVDGLLLPMDSSVWAAAALRLLDNPPSGSGLHKPRMTMWSGCEDRYEGFSTTWAHDLRQSSSGDGLDRVGGRLDLARPGASDHIGNSLPEPPKDLRRASGRPPAAWGHRPAERPGHGAVVVLPRPPAAFARRNRCVDRDRAQWIDRFLVATAANASHRWLGCRRPHSRTARVLWGSLVSLEQPALLTTTGGPVVLRVLPLGNAIDVWSTPTLGVGVLTKELRRGATLSHALRTSFPPRPRVMGSPPDRRYRRWLARTASQAASVGPATMSVSVLMPVYDPDPAELAAAIGSVVAQTHLPWQLCLVDDGSTRPEVQKTLREAAKDHRVTLVVHSKSLGVSAATNAALASATGEIVAFMDHDDLLEPDALSLMAHTFTDSGVAAAYSDEDTVDIRGRPRSPSFKTRFDAERLLSQNFVNHLFCARTALIRELGGLRIGLEGAQDHDLVLRVAERAPDGIRHIPRVLYHWRRFPGGGTLSQSRPDGAAQARQRATRDHLAARGLSAARRAGARRLQSVEMALALPAAKGAVHHSHPR